MKSILLAVADPQALVDITQALDAEWEPTSVGGEAEALALLEQRSFDALLVDFNLGDPDASELLNQAMEKCPETTRFLLAYESDLALVAAKVLGTPNILPKPVEPASLKSRLENGLNDANSKQSDSEPAVEATEAQANPSVYADVLKALESPDVTAERVGGIIAQYEALTSEVLRLTNSSYLGLPRNITHPVEAVESLGLEAVKALVMALQFLVEHSRLKPGYLSLDQLWQHSINVAQIARDLVLFETKDRTLASQALTAGLLHDLGKVVLAANFDDLYGRVHSLARKQPVALWDVEKEMFGANHGEIGACLVGMWNMPSAIVEATALHHEPPLGEAEQLTPLAAVHIANVLERQLRPSGDDMLVSPVINTTFLNELGLLQRLPVWRAVLANRLSENVESQAGSAEDTYTESTVASRESRSRTGNQLPPPAAATRTSTSGQPGGADEEQAAEAPRHRKTWVLAGVAAALLLASFWFKNNSDLDQDEAIYARTPARHEARVDTSSIPAPDTDPAPPPQVAPSPAVVEESPAPTVPAQSPPKQTAQQPTPSQPAPARTADTAISATTTNFATVSAPPEVKPQPQFHLNGIIYTSVRPSAMINGRTVYIGDQVNGADVIGIGPSTVTLRINGQRKTYELQ